MPNAPKPVLSNVNLSMVAGSLAPRVNVYRFTEAARYAAELTAATGRPHKARPVGLTGGVVAEVAQ
jgi:hypothetical protein